MRERNKVAQRLYDEFNIINNWDLNKRGGAGVWVDHTAVVHGRAGIGSNHGWAVRSLKKNLGQDWHDAGSRWFTGKKSNQEVMMEALRFASEHAQCNRWVKSPLGGYITTIVADAVGIKYAAKSVIEISDVKDGATDAQQV